MRRSTWIRSVTLWRGSLLVNRLDGIAKRKLKRGRKRRQERIRQRRSQSRNRLNSIKVNREQRLKMAQSTNNMTQSSRQRQFFGTDGIRGRVGIWPITPEFVLKLGWAVGKVLARQGNGKLLIGKDTRISGYMFESVLESGLSAAGIDTHMLGPMPTPAIAYLTRTLRA